MRAKWPKMMSKLPYLNLGHPRVSVLVKVGLAKPSEGPASAAHVLGGAVEAVDLVDVDASVGAECCVEVVPPRA